MGCVERDHKHPSFCLSPPRAVRTCLTKAFVVVVRGITFIVVASAQQKLMVEVTKRGEGVTQSVSERQALIRLSLGSFG